MGPSSPSWAWPVPRYCSSCCSWRRLPNGCARPTCCGWPGQSTQHPAGDEHVTVYPPLQNRHRGYPRHLAPQHPPQWCSLSAGPRRRAGRYRTGHGFCRPVAPAARLQGPPCRHAGLLCQAAAGVTVRPCNLRACTASGRWRAGSLRWRLHTVAKRHFRTRRLSCRLCSW